jgi:hypothetical protein
MPKKLKARDFRRQPRGKYIDMTGQRFGKLVVLRVYGKRKQAIYWLCQCDCGRTTRVSGSNLRTGSTRSCGCGVGQGRRLTRPPEYKFWVRRIRDDTTFRDFETFLAYVGPRPSMDHILYRSDIHRPWAPGNCEWRLHRDCDWNQFNPPQGRIIEHGGLRLSLSEWAKRLGITKQGLRLRLAQHDVPTALSPGRLKPSQAWRRKRKRRG